jgi:DNA primase
MPWIDYKHIKRSVPFERVLAYYGVKLKPAGDHQLVGYCPLTLHAGDRSNQTAFHVDTQKNIFNCFTHCGGGNVIDFAAKMEDCSFRDAAVMLYKCFLADESAPEEKPTYGATAVHEDSQEGHLENKPLTFTLQGLNSNHPFLRKTKGLTFETIKEFGLGFCTKGLLAGWLAIPIHNREGKIVAYIGRAVNDTQAEAEGKYKIPPGFGKSLEVFNLHRVLAGKETGKYGLIIVEGFFGVFWLVQNGYKNVVALMGKELSDRQAELLLSASDRFTVFLDGDESGRPASGKVAARLARSAFVKVIECPKGPKRKPAHFNKEELKELLSIQKPSP